MDIFAKIAAGEIPSWKCAESENFYAFLDINPLVKGHTLVIPRREGDYYFDMTDEEIAEMAVFAKKVAVPSRTLSHAARWAWRCSDWKWLMPTFTSCRCRTRRTCSSLTLS